MLAALVVVLRCLALPTPRRIHAPTEGRVVAFAEVGGLHHRYERRAA